MKLVANRINQCHLRDILPEISQEREVDSVLAAIAYGRSASDETKDLIGHSVDNKLRLDLWMRYDETVPVSIELLKRLLKHQKDNIFTKFVPDCFHAKVIWWKGYGAYIGSANHTDRGWLTNVEAGVFLEEDELFSNGVDEQLDSFFEYLRQLDNCIPISEQYIKEMEMLELLNKDVYVTARTKRTHAVWDGPSFVNKKVAFDRKKESFKSEWLNALGILHSIQDRINEYRPVWVREDIPAAWQVDQFLHAYYYNRLGDRLRKPYEDEYQTNRKNPEGALRAHLDWWKELKEAPSGENRNFEESAPLLRKLLQKERCLTVTEQEVMDICRNTHATVDHIIKIPVASLGRPDADHIDREERVRLFAPLLLKERNAKGWDVRKLIHYVLYEGSDKDLWERLYHAGRDWEFRIPRYGLNSLAEIVGWVRPEVAPPRNGRTSKALRALGFDVKVY